jgi:hypothetical protein
LENAIGGEEKRREKNQKGDEGAKWQKDVGEEERWGAFKEPNQNEGSTESLFQKLEGGFGVFQRAWDGDEEL